MASLLRPDRSVAGLWVAACVLTGGVGLGACGSSSGSRPASNQHVGTRPASTGARSTPAAPSNDVRADEVERAVLSSDGPPRPTSANCAVATAAERNASPFGRTPLPVFSCLLTVGGERARYAVQVLRDGCYVAERDRPGRAVYGCGVPRS